MKKQKLFVVASIVFTNAVLSFADCTTPVKKEESECTGMQLIPAGSFLMGSSDRGNERPVREVYVDAFYIDRCEVTNDQWKRFIDANPSWQKDKIDDRYHDGNYLKEWSESGYPAGKAKHPVVFVSWYAAAAYAEWQGKRLPTEAEWEKSARGPHGYKYTYGDVYDATKANTGGRIGLTTPVGSYEPNDYGLYDMTGNVLEWCSDWYGEDYYAAGVDRNPKGPQHGESRVIRGGAWNYFKSRCTTTFRFYILPPNANRTCTSNIGFRCAKDTPP